MAGKNTPKLLLLMLVQQRISLKNSGLPLIMMTHCVLVCCEVKLNVTYTCFFSIADEDEDDIQNIKGNSVFGIFLNNKDKEKTVVNEQSHLIVPYLLSEVPVKILV